MQARRKAFLKRLEKNIEILQSLTEMRSLQAAITKDIDEAVTQIYEGEPLSEGLFSEMAEMVELFSGTVQEEAAKIINAIQQEVITFLKLNESKEIEDASPLNTPSPITPVPSMQTTVEKLDESKEIKKPSLSSTPSLLSPYLHLHL